MISNDFKYSKRGIRGTINRKKKGEEALVNLL